MQRSAFIAASSLMWVWCVWAFRAKNKILCACKSVCEKKRFLLINGIVAFWLCSPLCQRCHLVFGKAVRGGDKGSVNRVWNSDFNTSSVSTVQHQAAQCIQWPKVIALHLSSYYNSEQVRNVMLVESSSTFVFNQHSKRFKWATKGAISAIISGQNSNKQQ